MLTKYENPSFLKLLGLSVLLGVLIGICCIWLFVPSTGSFVASVGAGVAFAVTVGIISRFTNIIRKTHFAIAAIIGGCVGGGAWWVIAKPEVSIVVSVIMGASFAAIAFWSESAIIFPKKTG
jgi:hypothetical protein